jgi:hypothetical protein
MQPDDPNSFENLGGFQILLESNKTTAYEKFYKYVYEEDWMYFGVRYL